MPKKDDAPPPKAAMTNAMGMKMTLIASECWRNQVRKEQQIREEWLKTYAPKLQESEEEIAQKVRELDEAKKKAAAELPERHILTEGVSKDGTGRALYLKKRHCVLPQLKQSTPVTSSQVIGWTADKLPPPRTEGLQNFGRKPVIRNGFYRGQGAFTDAGKETKFY